jgi:hypothetical protein
MSQPWTLEVDKRLRCGTLTFDGPTTGNDAFAATLALWDHPDWEPGYSELWDGATVTEVDVSFSDMKRIAELENIGRSRHAGGRVAIVSSSRVVRAAMVTVIALMGTNPRPHRIFATRAEALAWLAEA